MVQRVGVDLDERIERQLAVADALLKASVPAEEIAGTVPKLTVMGHCAERSLA
jgi:hypothetical protein